MRDEYVGDIGDFGKYILLKELQNIADGKAKIGINWYYNKRPTAPFKYLDDNEYKLMDKDLLSSLQDLNNDRRPRLSDIEDKGIVREFRCYKEPIPCADELQRKIWFDKSLSYLNDTDIVFLDPDNGLPSNKMTKDKPDAVKYAFIDELKSYYNEGKKSVILYQHKNRKRKKDNGGFLPWFLKEIKNIDHQRPIIIQCPRVTVRYYALIAKTDEHYTIFNRLLEKLKAYPLLFDV